MKAGAVFSLSGRFALQGVQAQCGLALWAEDTNAAGGLDAGRLGRLPVELIVADDASRVAQAIEQIRRLIVDEQVDLLFGPYSSVLTLAVAPIAEQHRKLLWNHGGATDALIHGGFHHVVSILSPASRYFAGLLELARALDPGVCRVALLYGARGTFPQEVIAGAEAFARRHGFEVALKAAYPATPGGFAALASEAAASQPDLVLGVGRTEEDLAFAQELVAHRVETCVAGLVAAPLQLFGQTLGAAAHGFAGPSQWEPGAPNRPDLGPTSAEFVERFVARYGSGPEYPAAQAYAAGLIAQHCIALSRRRARTSRRSGTGST